MSRSVWLAATIALLATACLPTAEPELTQAADHIRLVRDKAVMVQSGVEAIIGEGIPLEATRAAVFEDGLVVELGGKLINWNTRGVIAEGLLIGSSRDGTLLAYFYDGVLHIQGAETELEFDIECQGADLKGVWDWSNIYLGLVCGDRLYRVDANPRAIHEHQLPIRLVDISFFGEGFGLLAVGEDGQRTIHRTTCHPDLHTLSDGLPAPVADVVQYVGTAVGDSVELMLASDGSLWKLYGSGPTQIDGDTRFIGEVPGDVSSRWRCRTGP